MIVTVTYIQLRNPWLSFKLTLFGYKIMQQARRSPGFIRMTNRGFWTNHYTLSAWENEAAMKTFSRTGAHLAAMQQSKSLANKLSTYSYHADQLPDWPTAKKILHEKGKVLAF